MEKNAALPHPIEHSSVDCEQLIEVTNIKMQMIQFSSILNFIQVKLMKSLRQYERQDEQRISILLRITIN
jgi:phosphoenolpyruvate carboxylase